MNPSSFQSTNEKIDSFQLPVRFVVVKLRDWESLSDDCEGIWSVLSVSSKVK